MQTPQQNFDFHADARRIGDPPARRPDSGYRVLLVISESPTRREIVASLRAAEARLEIIETATGHDAVEITEQEPVDCALVESMLPDCDGVGLMAILRHRDSLRPIPTILLGEAGSAGLTVAALRSGASDYLCRDRYSGSELLRAITFAVERSRLLQAIELQGHQIQEQKLALEQRQYEHLRRSEELAHSILTPLASIQEFVSLVMDGVSGSISDEQGKFLAYARGSCQEIRSRIEALVVSNGMNRAEHHRDERFHLTELFEELVQQFDLEARYKGVHLHLAVEDTLPQIRGNAFAIKQMLSRLLSRTLQISTESSTVLLRAEFDWRNGQNVQITVSARPGHRQGLAGQWSLHRAPRSWLQVEGEDDFVVESTIDDAVQFRFDVPVNGSAA